MDENGLVTVESSHPVEVVLNRLETTLSAKGIALFARVDHAAGAASVGLALRPTTVTIFGDPRAGTPLMQADQRIGLDLPLKVLTWEDDRGRTQVTYSDPRWVTRRYALADDAADHLAAALEALVDAITA